MKKRRLLWRLFVSYLLIILICVLAATLFLSRQVRIVYYNLQFNILEELALMAEPVMAELVEKSSFDQIQHQCQEMSAKTGVRFTVILADGVVVGDSHHHPSTMDNHANRPEVLGAATTGLPSHSTRESTTLRDGLIYLAVPIFGDDGQQVGTMRAGRYQEHIDKELNTIWKRVWISLFVAIGFSVIVAFTMARRLSKPIEELRRGAERFGAGNFKRKIPSQPSLELGGLAEALNRMAAELDEQISEITSSRNEHQAILGSMEEGVLAVDSNERVLSINSAGEKMLGLNGRSIRGRLVQEVLRNVEIQRMLARALKGDYTVENEDSIIRPSGSLVLEAKCAPLRDGDGNDIGVLLLLVDVTRLHRLENLRREFVSNVSHELRTPITSIKGFAETLLDGGLDDPEDAKHFVEIIDRQSDRLGKVIEDLLSLSRLDRQEEIDKQQYSLNALIDQAIELCTPMARDFSMEITTDLASDQLMELNPVLITQAITNLIENAIKYCPDGKKVDVVTERLDDNRIAIRVRDYGTGIAREHLDRIFERFYRVDKARSREVGGTGLGLSIVKNVAQAHGGFVGVETEPGLGSTFSMVLPIVSMDSRDAIRT